MKEQRDKSEHSLYLSAIIGLKVTWNGKKVGRLDDLVIRETGVVPEVTAVVVSRPFGAKDLLVPYKDAVIEERRVVLAVADLAPFERDNIEGLVLLKDHILDKKVVDLEDHEVEMVYDVRLIKNNGALYVSDVDCSRYSFLRRLGLSRLADWINSMADALREETISWKYVQHLPEDLGSFKGSVKLNILKENIREIHPVDLADILEELDQEHRITIFNELDVEQASDTLEEIEPRVQREIISAIGDEKAADLIDEMTPAQAADVLSALPAADADDIMALMEHEDVDKIEAIMEDHEKVISDFATDNFIQFLPQTTVDEVLDTYREVARDADVIWYIYVVAENGELLGLVNFHSVLRAEPTDKLVDVMVGSVKSLLPGDSLAEAVEMFERYSFRAIPIVDEGGVIHGVVPYRDVMKLKHNYV